MNSYSAATTFRISRTPLSKLRPFVNFNLPGFFIIQSQRFPRPAGSAGLLCGFRSSLRLCENRCLSRKGAKWNLRRYEEQNSDITGRSGDFSTKYSLPAAEAGCEKP